MPNEHSGLVADLNSEARVSLHYAMSRNFKDTAEAEGEVRVLLNRFKPASNFILLIVPRRYFCGGSYCFMS